MLLYQAVPWNAYPPIDSTVLGIVILLRFLQSLKAEAPIEVTPFGMYMV